MSRTYDRPIIIQKVNETTETWEDLYKIHASVNKSRNDSEYLNGGAIQAKRALVFEVRYFKELEAISYNTQIFRLVYQGIKFDIEDYDDFKLEHKTVRLLGVSY